MEPAKKKRNRERNDPIMAPKFQSLDAHGTADIYDIYEIHDIYQYIYHIYIESRKVVLLVTSGQPYRFYLNLDL